MVFGTIRSVHVCIALGQMHCFFPRGWIFKGAIPHCILPYISLNYIKHHQATLEIFRGEIPQNGIIPGSLLELFPTFHFSPYFVHVLFMSFQRTPDGIRWPCVVRGKKGQDALGCHMFCHVLVVFWGVPDISATPRIISLCRKSHRMAFNLALSWKCSQLANLSFFPLFLPSSFQQEAFGCWVCYGNPIVSWRFL